MAIRPDYTSGTITLTAGLKAVVGVGTAWSLIDLQPGDTIMRAGRVHAIEDVVDDTHLTLAEAWSGATMAGVTYAIRYHGEDARVTAAARSLVEKLSTGIVESIAGLAGAADKMFWFTGPATLSVLDFKEWARTFISAANQSAGQTALGMSALMKVLLATTTGASFLITLGAKEVLTANRTYYVRADGSNSNNGLADTSGGAFLTKQFAFNKIAASIDFAGYTVTIKVNLAGTYTPLNLNTDWVGGGQLIIEGDTVTPANVIISATTTSAFRASVPISAPVFVRGFTCNITGASIGAVSLEANCRMNVQSLRANVNVTGFGAVFTASSIGAVLTFQGTAISVSGSNASAFMYAGNGGQITNFGATTITILGTPTWSWIGTLCVNATITFNTVTITGAATGTRYLVTVNGSINTGGGGANFLPGSVAGSFQTGGQYIP